MSGIYWKRGKIKSVTKGFACQLGRTLVAILVSVDNLATTLARKRPMLFLKDWMHIAIYDDFELVRLSENSANEVKICAASSVCLNRIRTYPSKEPTTRSWISSMGGEIDLLVDIGSNIGQYSLMFCAEYGKPAVAIEPNPSNLLALHKNVEANGFSKLIYVYPVAASAYKSFLRVDELDMTIGGARTFDSYGAAAVKAGKGETSGLSFVAANILSLPVDEIYESFPAHEKVAVKLDVDGGELSVLEGMVRLLHSPKCKTVLVELLPDQAALNREITDFLTSFGFDDATASLLRGHPPRDHNRVFQRV